MTIIKNKKLNLFLALNMEPLNELEGRGAEEFLKYSSSREEGEVQFGDASLFVQEIYMDGDKTILISGDMIVNGKNVGYISLNIPLFDGLMIDILEYQMKRYGKIKTVLEATKDD